MLRITERDGDWNPKYFAPLCGLFCALYVITSAVNTKFIEISDLALPGGILIFPLCCIITDLMTEVYGFNRTRQAIWACLAGTVLYGGFTQLVMILPSPEWWGGQAAYETIFATSWRFALAGCLAWLAGEFVNSFIMSKMKILQNARHMPLRFFTSTLVGQFFDTAVFATVAFAGVMPAGEFVKMILIIWMVKTGYEALALPLSVPLARALKRAEGVDHYDRQKLSLV